RTATPVTRSGSRRRPPATTSTEGAPMRLSRIMRGSRITSAHVIAMLALFVALGGSSYAAVAITGANVKNSSLTGADLKNESVTGGDVDNSSLTGSDIKSSSLTTSDVKD